MAFRAPLLGYNTNVRHKGRLYHIQTEDSGVGHPHIITHLFADGGRIVGSKKTSYAEHLNAEALSGERVALRQGLALQAGAGASREELERLVETSLAVWPTP